MPQCENSSWSKDTGIRRIVFLVGDAPPHMDYENAPNIPEVLRTADDKGIIVNAVQAGDDPDTRNIWKDIAQRGGGRYIPQDGGEIVVIETPYDNDIIELQQRIDRTVIPYGGYEKQAEVRTKMAEKAEVAAPIAIDNSSFYSKRSSAKEVITGGGDLLADIRNGTNTLEKIKDNELPDAFRNKSLAKRKALVSEKIAERSKLEDAMAELVRHRDEFVAKHEKDKPQPEKNSFDRAVADTLKQQL